ncbi:MAG: DNA/RNA non-specific endonuclease [Aestuariivirga sp.]
MDTVRTAQLDKIVRARIAGNRNEIEHSLRQIAAGNPLGSEPKQQRSEERLAKKTGFSPRDAGALAAAIKRAAEVIDSGKETASQAEAVQGPTIDFVGVEFLWRGRVAANAVGRIAFLNGQAQGTGFLVGPGILLTNNHVIGSAGEAGAMCVEFDYELGELGEQRDATTFSFEPDQCFVTDPADALDFTLVALGARISGQKELVEFGYIPLSDAPDKHMLGEIANIVQHPLGRRKQVVVRENNLVSRDETNDALHYVADTERGASGSPVFNNEWEVVALHHWGGPHLEIKGPSGNSLRQDINEGIRASAIVRSLRKRSENLTGLSGEATRRLLSLWQAAPRGGPIGSVEPQRETNNQNRGGTLNRKEADGSITWTFPIEITVRAPLLSPPEVSAVQPVPAPPSVAGSEAKKKKMFSFDDRDGYEPGFIPGFVVPLPRMDKLPYRLARNQQAAPGDGPNELRYHHFSIFVNAERRLAALTACNIDGGRIVAVDRETKEVTKNPTLTQLGIEALRDGGGAEASDDFRPDPRVADSEQMTVEFYQDQKVPGFAKPEHPGKDATPEEKRAYARAMNERTARMFQKGHIILRGDPAWGTIEAAVAAENDTFFYTNAAPQLGFFNQGSPDNRPGAKGKLRWRAVETFVLRNAVTGRQRICVFAGPVFDDDYDVAYRQDVKVPMRFWKIAVWADGSELRSIALLADQKPVLEKLTKGVPEAFEDDEELIRVTEFLSTVKDIEQRTGLNFGKAIANADVRRGGNEEAISDKNSLRLAPPARETKKRNSAR